MLLIQIEGDIQPGGRWFAGGGVAAEQHAVDAVVLRRLQLGGRVAGGRGQRHRAGEARRLPTNAFGSIERTQSQFGRGERRAQCRRRVAAAPLDVPQRVAKLRQRRKQRVRHERKKNNLKVRET